MADEDVVRLPAARFLARFHQVGRHYPDRSPRPSIPAWATWDWGEGVWPLIEEALFSPPRLSQPSVPTFPPGNRRLGR